MSIKKEPIKNKKNALSIEIRKELTLLPNIIKEKKLEKEIIYKDILLIKERVNTIKKELDKITVNILNYEKEYTSLMLKSDKVKMNQKIILNLINNEDINNITLLQNNDLKELIILIYNSETEYKEEISNFLSNNDLEITKLLIGAYTYLKMLQKDIPLKYKQMKENIMSKVIKLKQRNEENIVFNLIISYIENIFIILDNKEKNKIFNTKHESLIKKKNEIFIKLKLVEEQKKTKEDKLNLISCFIKDLINIIEKNKLLKNFPKNNNEKNIDKNKKIIVAQNSLNISCPKNTINNEFGINNENKISIINIELTNTSSLEKKYYNKIDKKTIESLELNNINMKKKIDINKYKSIYELEKDIHDHYIKIKNNPLFKMKKKLLKKKINNNTNVNNNSNANTNNNNINKQNKLFSDKSKEKLEKISKNNTTMIYNTHANSIINNINHLINHIEINQSYDSTITKKEKEKEKEKEKLMTNIGQENKKVIEIKYPLTASIEKRKETKEEKKNNIEEEKNKGNLSLNENNAKNNNKNVNIKHNKTNLKKKNSLNKIKINTSKNEFEMRISCNNNNFYRKNSPDNMNSGFFFNMNKANKDKYREIKTELSDIKYKNKSPYSNSLICNNNTNKNCHIIPFKKYKINYIKDNKNFNKTNKFGIRINPNNYDSDKLKGNHIRKKLY